MSSAKADRLGAYFLDVGQGDCSFVIDTNGEGVLFDCRDDRVAQQFVLHHDVKHLRAVVVSHLDLDHIRGMQSFLTWFLSQKNRRLDEIYIGFDRPGLPATATALIQSVLRWQKEGRLKLGRPEREARPKTIWENGDTRVDIVLPHYHSQLADRMEGGERPNPSSAVLRVHRAGTTILIGGDAPLGSWEKIEPDLLPARLFRAPHHAGDIDEGATHWTATSLYERVGAEDVVVSVGTHNGYGHPSADHVDAMQLGRCRLVCTQLTPRCHPNPVDLRPGFEDRGAEVVVPYRHRLRRLRPLEVPCAGSVVAWIKDDGSVEVLPARGDWHEAFVRRAANPLCLWRGALVGTGSGAPPAATAGTPVDVD